ncbi:Replication factor C subunit 2 [Vitis vinifera]|uniref:Replication factor C subunit 2 n=1 Tax=Vitis vinifera TaxID=29760 RepID=A0A438EU62_VITVI|nr:Replication factor C subunit 2 [Vitis vinifera]
MAPVLQSSQPWVEKYRPKQVKDVAHQDEVVRVLTNTLETTNLSAEACKHIETKVLHEKRCRSIDGTEGVNLDGIKGYILKYNCSKNKGIYLSPVTKEFSSSRLSKEQPSSLSSSIRLVKDQRSSRLMGDRMSNPAFPPLKEVLIALKSGRELSHVFSDSQRPELYKSRVLELNASDDRGINVVRTKIKDFAAVAVGSGHRQGGYPCPPYKIIILDEADSMTEDAQNALRRTMETYSKVTRFFFICNYISRIIEPLASRCAKFRFKPLSEEIMSSRILHICKEEELNLDSEALSTLSSISQGDLRRAITYLQGAARLFGSIISSKDLISVSGVVPQHVVQALFAACKSGDFDSANKEVNNVIAEGYPVSQMLYQLFDVVVEADISDEQKARICKRLAEADKCLVDGADEYLQLLDVASNAMRALCNMPEEFPHES